MNIIIGSLIGVITLIIFFLGGEYKVILASLTFVFCLLMIMFALRAGKKNIAK